MSGAFSITPPSSRPPSPSRAASFSSSSTFSTAPPPSTPPQLPIAAHCSTASSSSTLLTPDITPPRPPLSPARSTPHYSPFAKSYKPNHLLDYLSAHPEVERSARKAGILAWEADSNLSHKVVGIPDPMKPYGMVGLRVFAPVKKSVVEWCLEFTQQTGWNTEIAPVANFPGSINSINRVSSLASTPSSRSSPALLSKIDLSTIEATTTTSGNAMPGKGKGKETPHINSGTKKGIKETVFDHRRMLALDSKDEGGKRARIYSSRLNLNGGIGNAELLKASVSIILPPCDELKAIADIAEPFEVDVNVVGEKVVDENLEEDSYYRDVIRVDLIMAPGDVGDIGENVCTLRAKETSTTSTVTKPISLSWQVGGQLTSPHGGNVSANVGQPATTQAEAETAQACFPNEDAWALVKEQTQNRCSILTFVPSTKQPHILRIPQRGLHAHIVSSLEDASPEAPLNVVTIIHQRIEYDSNPFSVRNYVSVTVNAIEVVDIRYDDPVSGAIYKPEGTYSVLGDEGNIQPEGPEYQVIFAQGSNAAATMGSALRHVFIRPTPESRWYCVSRRIRSRWRRVRALVRLYDPPAALPRPSHVDPGAAFDVRLYRLNSGDTDPTPMRRAGFFGHAHSRRIASWRRGSSSTEFSLT